MRGNKMSRDRVTELLHERWSGMKARCDDPRNQKYPNYGARGVTYEPDWKDFSVYNEDVRQLEGWDEKKLLEGDLRMDKDTRIKGSKIYSNETCRWITNAENMLVKPSYQKERYAYNWCTNTLYNFFNTNQFAKFHSLKPQSISSTANRCDNVQIHNPKSLGDFVFWNAGNKNIKNIYVYKAEDLQTGEVVTDLHQKRVADKIGSNPSTVYKLRTGVRKNNSIYTNPQTQKQYRLSMKVYNIATLLNGHITKQELFYDKKTKSLTVIEKDY